MVAQLSEVSDKKNSIDFFPFLFLLWVDDDDEEDDDKEGGNKYIYMFYRDFTWT